MGTGGCSIGGGLWVEVLCWWNTMSMVYRCWVFIGLDDCFIVCSIWVRFLLDVMG